MGAKPVILPQDAKGAGLALMLTDTLLMYEIKGAGTALLREGDTV
jgi:hypothetical protein